MRQSYESIVRLLLKLLIRFHLVAIISYLCLRSIKQRKPDGSLVPIKLSKVFDKRKCILVLTASEFRGDTAALSQFYDVYEMPPFWQYHFLKIFELDRKDIYSHDFYNAARGVGEQRSRYRRFLKPFLSQVFKQLPVFALVTPHFRYARDMDWCLSAQKLGIPHVVLFREGLALTEGPIFDQVVERYLKMDRFNGDHLVVQTQRAKEMFLKADFAREDQLHVLGTLRMDNFIDLSKSWTPNKNGRKQVVLFSVFEKMTYYGEEVGAVIFEKIHRAFIQLAAKRPDVDFIIKPKPKFAKQGSEWRLRIEEMLHAEGYSWESLVNLSIQGDLDIHDLLMKTDVACGVQSTALLEAGITGMPVVVAAFHEHQNSEDYKRFAIRKYLHLFDKVEDEIELASTIEYRLDYPQVEDTVIEQRRDLFDKEVTGVRGAALDHYIRFFNDLSLNSKSKQVCDTGQVLDGYSIPRSETGVYGK